jgi:hypothetical protein
MKYASWSKAKILRSLVRREATMVKLRNKTRQTRSAKSSSSLLAVARSRRDTVATLTFERTGRQKSQFCARSFIAIGVRRNMSNISTQDFQHAALRKVSRWTVARAETLAAAALHAAHRDRMLAAGDTPDALAEAVAVDSRLVIGWTGAEVIASVQLDDISTFTFTCTTSDGCPNPIKSVFASSFSASPAGPPGPPSPLQGGGAAPATTNALGCGVRRGPGSMVEARVACDLADLVFFPRTRFRGDATNAGCWRGSKLHATMVDQARFVGQDIASRSASLSGLLCRCVIRWVPARSQSPPEV